MSYSQRSHKNRLLIITYHFPPSGASAVHRVLGFARHLPKFGWDAIIVAPPLMPTEPTDEELVGFVPVDAKVYSVPFPRSRVLNRMLGSNMPFTWFPMAL